MKNFIIGIDAGTTGIRVFCFDKKANIISMAYEEFTQIFPRPGWVEHNPEEIWTKTEKLISQAIRKGNLKAKSALGIGITNQRETTVLFERNSGKPIHNAIVWQCRRTVDLCNELKKRGLEEEFRSKTGLVIDAYFSATKVEWILNKIKNARAKAQKGNLLFGTIDTWLLYNLTNKKSHATDYTNASRTMLYHILDKKWDKEILSELNIPKNILPEVLPSRALFGKTEKVKGLPDGIPILSMIGDQQGALFGQLCTDPGEAKNTYGTGCFLLFNIGNRFKLSKNGLITTLACGPNGEPVYALEGSIFIGGAVVQWLRDYMKFVKTSKESENIAKLTLNDDEVVFVPAFSGLGAPHWNMDARGAIFGLTRDTNQAQIVKAALKSIAFQSMDLVHAMEHDTGQELKILKVDGGATANDYLMQFQSDILNKKVIRPKNLDTTVLGAALLAGQQIGFYPETSKLKKLKMKFKKFTPHLSASGREREISLWTKSVERLLT